MSATKLSASLVLTAGLITAGLFAEAAPAKSIHYSDSAKVPPGSTPEGAVYTFMDPADPAVTDLAQFGFKAIEQIGGRLVLETTRELATKETQLAVATLHLKDMELPKPVAGKPTITAVRRTSVLIRDPRNAPDGADAAALNKIDTQLKDGESPDKMIVQKIEQAGRPVEWRVYRPIAASKSCLSCHGDPNSFQPGVKEALDRLYPEDKAVAYTAQEWRGVIRVSLAAATPAAQK